MVGLVHPHKVVVRRNVFLVFPSAWNEVELEGEAKSEKLNCQFLKVKDDLYLQKIPNPIPISNKRAPK
jgi:hypothetical protein